ncbi:MAG TPA: CaiB/BaiF CoA-transferase family protein [Devosiaceae bacterium]|jgi:formyl-CoA transferase
MTNSNSDGPLSGLVVIDAGTVLAAPLAALQLGDYGARVIKVEHPDGGDIGRSMGSGGAEVGSWWRFLGRNKESVTCNFSTSEGAQLFLELVRKADVLIENFRPGTFEKWGLSYEALKAENPRLVMLRISGFGQFGPDSERPGYGTLADSISGLTYMTGFPDGPPILPGGPIADAFTAQAGVSAVMTALWNRERTGAGAVIDLPLYGGLMYMYGMHLTEASIWGTAHERRGNQVPRLPWEPVGYTLRDVVKCSDGGWVCFSIVSPKLIKRLAHYLNGLDPADQIEMVETVTGDWKQVVGARMRRWLAVTPRDSVLAELIETGVPIAPIYSMTDMLADPHFEAREEFDTVTHADGKVARMPRGPYRIDAFGPHVRTPAPALGAANDVIYRDLLGIAPERLETLRQSGAI